MGVPCIFHGSEGGEDVVDAPWKRGWRRSGAVQRVSENKEARFSVVFVGGQFAAHAPGTQQLTQSKHRGLLVKSSRF